MNKRDYYYFREILLGLKCEYLKCDEELQKLKQYAQTDSEKINNYYFWLCQWEGQRKPELRCVIEAKKSKIEQLIERIKKKIGTYAYPYDFECRFNNNGETILGDHGLYVFGNSDEFCSQAQAILNSEFTNGIFLDRIFSSDNKNAYVSANHIFIKYTYAPICNDYTTFEYRPIDSNRVGLNMKNITEKKLYDILDSTYPREKFPPYYQNVIDSNPSAMKPIEIVELPDMNRLYYESMELEELDNKVILKKIKR